MNFEKRKPIRSKKITRAAEGEVCTICGLPSETVVFCHLNESWAGKGMKLKADDIAGFFGCQQCHDVYDGRAGHDTISDYAVLRAMYKTWRRLWDRGIIGEL